MKTLGRVSGMLLAGLALLASAVFWAGHAAPIRAASEPDATAAATFPEVRPSILSYSNIPIQPTPPEIGLVEGLVGHRQSLPLSCEARSAADWAEFFGVKIDELEFFGALPRSDDPDRGFVGDVLGDWGRIPPNAYGVHAGPVARLLQQYGVPANYRLYMAWASVQAEVAAGRPVIVWVTGHVEAGAGRLYTASDGHRTVVAPFEHTVIVVGYTAASVVVQDGARQYSRPLDVFLRSWRALRYMAITART